MLGIRREASGDSARRRKGRTFLALVAVAVVLAGGVLIAVLTRSSEDTDTDQESDIIEQASALELPPPDSNLQVPENGHIAGPAPVVAEFRDLSETLLSIDVLPPVERLALCQTVANELDENMSPDDILEASFDIADPVLADLVRGERTVRSDLLVACIGGDQAEALAERARAEALGNLVDRRLQELGE